MVDFGMRSSNFDQSPYFSEEEVNGIGFDPFQAAEYEAGRGWGLLTMTERAEVVGARCWIESIPDQGRKVIVDVDR